MAERPFFFHHTLGYRRNPFGALQDDEWAAMAILPAVIRKLLTTNFIHLQLLGSMGSGKTTTLLKLADYFDRDGLRVAYEYLAPGEHRVKTAAADLDILLLDEAQRVHRRSWRKLIATLGQDSDAGLRLLLSSHRDLTARFARRGLPLVTMRLDEILTLDYYEQMLACRLDYFALPGAARTRLAPDAAAFLYDTFYPNLRRAEYFLYDVWQRETAVRQITANDLIHQYKRQQ